MTLIMFFEVKITKILKSGWMGMEFYVINLKLQGVKLNLNIVPV